jgi:hypothetical protein
MWVVILNNVRLTAVTFAHDLVSEPREFRSHVNKRFGSYVGAWVHKRHRLVGS